MGGQSVPEKTAHFCRLSPNSTLPLFALVLRYNPSPAGLLPAGTGNIPKHKLGVL